MEKKGLLVGWEMKKLLEISTVLTGKHNANHSKNDGKYRFYTCAYNHLFCDTKKFKGECLILPGNGVNVGEVFYFDGEFDAYQRTYVIFDIKINARYLHYHMLLYWKELGTKLQYGSATNFIKIGNFQDYEVSIAPLKEQKQIVAILDKAFAAIDTAKANAEQNLQNAKELFESYLQNVFDPSTRSGQEGDDWEEGEFGNIITTLTDYHANGSYKILKKNVELKDNEDYAWMIRSTDFENNFQNQFKYIDEHAYNFMSKSKVLGNEIIMSKIGNAGKVYLMPKINRPTSLAMNLFLIRLDENNALPEFIFRFLKSNKGESQILKRVKGATTKTITKDNVRNIIILYPPLEKQKKIVIKLDALSAETKKLEAIYTQKIADLEEMKKSILQKAFSGALSLKVALAV